jgi:RNA-directed DNA polymerase
MVSAQPASSDPRAAGPPQRDDAGHYAYYGVTANIRRLQRYAAQIKRIWKKWLSRRDRKGFVAWSRMQQLLDRHPLPPPRIVHRYAIGSEPLS